MSAFTARTTPIQTPVSFGVSNGFQVVTPLRQGDTESNRAAKNSPACSSTDVGHRVHFIQLKLAIGKPVEPFILQSVEGQSIFVDVDGQERQWFTHNTDNIQTLLNSFGQPLPGWSHEYNLIEIQGRVFSVVYDLSELAPCLNQPHEKNRAA